MGEYLQIVGKKSEKSNTLYGEVRIRVYGIYLEEYYVKSTIPISS